MASDGVFDVMTNQEAVEFVALELGLRKGVQKEDLVEADVAAACDALLAECLSRGSKDNMSVVVVLLTTSSSVGLHTDTMETPLYAAFSPSSLQGTDSDGAAPGFSSPAIISGESQSPIKAMRLFSA